MKNCYKCGDNFVEKRGTYRFSPPGNIPGGEMLIDNSSWIECEKCGTQMIPYDLNKKLEDLSMIRLGLLLPNQIFEIRNNLKISQKDMAKKIGVDEKLYIRWETGKSIQPKDIDDKIRSI